MSKLNLISIGTLFDLEKGSLQSSKCTEGEYTFITAAEEWKTHNEYSHECEALIFAAAASGSLGRTHYINNKFITSDLCFILTPKDSKKYPINLKFYHFVFNSLKDEIVKNTKSGTSKESINQSNLRNYEIPYFEIDKQNLWIDKLVNTKSIKEDLELELSTGQSLLKQLKQTILQEAIEGKLTAKYRAKNPDIGTAKELLEQIKIEKEKLVKDKKIKASKPLAPINENEIPFDVPQNWEWCRLGETGIFERGKSKHRPRNDETLFIDGQYPLIQTGDVSQSKYTNYLINTYNKKYNDFGLSQSRLWSKGTLCITIAANIAETGFLNIDACFPDSVVGFNSIDNTISKLIHYFLIISKEEIERFAPATAQKNINLEIINELYFPLPPLEEQKEIVATIEKLFAICDELESEINQNKTTVDNLMATVLKEAFKN
ncbi:MAG: restriction endonuclease subunit S [Arcobacter sp.]|uniref:restriction endonuclease subunit S n=1 Tax=Arcobacter sp. TaxID=1872629 RepID=UPI003D01B36B